MMDTRATFTKKTFNVEDFAIRWPLSEDKLYKREDRTILRDYNTDFQTDAELRNATIAHDLKVLAKWLQRGLLRKKALLINEPVVSMSYYPELELRVKQSAIQYDPIVYERYKDYKALMLPKGQSTLELAVFNG